MSIYSRNFSSAIALPLLIITLGACERATTGPSSDVQLSATSAPPLAMLSIHSLPARAASATIRVGAEAATLVYDPAAEVHRFLVPLDTRGNVRVRLPANVTGAGAVELALYVEPIEYAGGSADAATALLVESAKGLQSELTRALNSLEGAEDTLLASLASNLERSVSLLHETLASLTAEERALVAAIYSAERRSFDGVLQHLTRLGEPGASFSAAGTGQAPASLPTTEMLAKQCIEANLDLEFVNDLLFAAAYYDLALPTLAALTTRSPRVAASVAMMTNAVLIGLHSGIRVQGLKRRFFAPEGLRIEPRPVRVREAGGTGEMRAYLRLVGANSEEAGDASFGNAMREFRSNYRDLDEIRRMSQSEAWRRAAVNAGIAAIVFVLDEAFDLLQKIYSDDETGPAGEIPVAMDGIEIQDVNHSGLWRFTSPAEGPSRAFQTVGEIRRELGYDIVALAAIAGRGESCTARTAPGHPQDGFNGFVVTGPPLLRSPRYSLTSLNSCITSAGTGSRFRIEADFSAANTLGPGSRVDVTWSFSPSGVTGGYSWHNDGHYLGSQGTFWFEYCARYNDDTSTTIRFTAVDPEGLRSNALAVTIPQPAGANSKAPDEQPHRGGAGAPSSVDSRGPDGP